MATLSEIRASDPDNTLTGAEILLEDKVSGGATKAPILGNSSLGASGSSIAAYVKNYLEKTGIIYPPTVLTITSSATPTIDVELYNSVTITALATAITSMDSGYSGTASDFDRLTIRIKDNGTLRAITWGTTNWESAGVPLPTTTTAGKLMTIGFIYNDDTSKWGCVAFAEEI